MYTQRLNLFSYSNGQVLSLTGSGHQFNFQHSQESKDRNSFWVEKLNTVEFGASFTEVGVNKLERL